MSTLNRQLLKIQIGTGTKANILKTKTNNTAWNGETARSTDTNELYVYDSTASQWNKSPFPLVAQSPNPDIGLYQDSSAIGIFPADTSGNAGHIVNYWLEDVVVGSSGKTTTGGLRFNGGYLQVYANSTWNNVVVGFTFSELAGYGYALTHQPTGLTYPLEVMSGNSITNLGLNGLPITQGYITDMGAYPSYQSVGGRII